MKGASILMNCLYISISLVIEKITFSRNIVGLSLDTKKKQSPYSVIVLRNVGMFGYYSGTEKIIIDPLALTDPLLARLPVTGKWRIGHFVRKVPDGYVDSLMNGNASIVNPQVNEFYKKLKIVTQNEELFTLERLKTIALFNVGAYNHLLLDE